MLEQIQQQKCISENKINCVNTLVPASKLSATKCDFLGGRLHKKAHKHKLKEVESNNSSTRENNKHKK